MVRADGRGVAGQGPARPRARRPPRPSRPSVDPVARVLVDVPLAHLDRPFDYAVPADDGRRRPCRAPGSRCGSPARTSTASSSTGVAEHRPRRAGWRRCAGWSAPSRCWRPQVAALAGDVAERYAGTRSDVLRLAVPPRHATTEKEPSARRRPAAPDVAPRPTAGLGRPRARPALPRATCAAGGSPRAVWAAAPGDRLAGAGRRTRSPRRSPSGRGALVCVPDGSDVARVDARADRGAGRGPARRARPPTPARPRATATSWRVSRGAAPGRGRHPGRGVRAGPRPRAWSSIWDDGDDLLRRAARALPAHPRGAAAARRARAARRC